MGNRSLLKKQPASHRALIFLSLILSLALGVLACGNVPQKPDSQATVRAFYATITAQAQSGSPFPTNAVTEQASEEATNRPTLTPSITPTAPEARQGNGVNLAISRCVSPVTVDGDPGEWAKMNPQPQSIVLDTPTFGKAEWQDRNDLSGQAFACWTDAGLYLLVNATDDIHVQNETGLTSWKGDEVEFFWDGDLRSDFYDTAYNTDDRQLGMSSGNFDNISPNAVEYRPDLQVLTANQLPVAARRAVATGGNFVLEAQIPWTVLNTSPEVNVSYGMCIALSDNDHVGESKQDTMVSHCINLETPDPTTFASVTLK
jgi:cellulose/xylan binding protein with CBM9 domain